NILMDSSLNEEQKDFVQVIKKSSDNLLVLINDILDISKIKAGKLRIENIDFNLRETVEHTMLPFNMKVMEKGLKLGVVVDRNIPDSLVGDPHRLNQILTNLLSNAIKFTEKGEINLEIKMLNSQKDFIALEFTISDTGIGVAANKLQYIFESFTQAETGITRKFGGTGLGLSITKKLIELQDGKIDVSSIPDKGTTFTFVITYSVGSQQSGAKQPQQVVEQEKVSNESLAGKKILVVEDNETNRKVIYHMLKKVELVSTMACNGREAVKLLDEGNQYDLIIMDLQMPEMDGFETTKYIRTKLNSTIPIIAMTASAMRNEKAKCLELGMSEYMTKPFIPAELYSQLRRYLLSADAEIAVMTQRPAEKHKNSEKPYSLDHLTELDDADCLCEILQLFLDSTPATLNEISEAIKEKNWEQVYKQSHKLKSSVGLLQMNELLSVITQMESDGKEQKNLNRLPEKFEKAQILFEEARPMIEAELKNASEVLIKS
ncbi:MAG: response regulator, partial [Bacteroidia bacterium]|nr:response regulator [Bacteroidia bacterium]